MWYTYFYMGKILVTGGAGFIGANFLEYMTTMHPDWVFVNLDALTYAGSLRNLDTLKDNAAHVFVKGDITDRELVASMFDTYRFDGVVNLAAESHVDRSIDAPGVFVKTNVLGTQCLLDAAKHSWRAGIDDAGYPVYRDGVRFVQVSTDEVYGSLGQDGCFTETSPLQPSSPYAASKAAADLIALSYHTTYHLPVLITRSSNNYGPYQFPEKLIPLMIVNALDSKPLPVYGDGMQVRDWLHVSDHCRAIEAVLLHGRVGEAYNIGGGNETANIDIVRHIIARLGVDDLITHVDDRLGHDRRYALNCTKITSELGWTPKVAFDRGLDDTIDWYVTHKDWIDSVRTDLK